MPIFLAIKVPTRVVRKGIKQMLAIVLFWWSRMIRKEILYVLTSII